MFLGPYHFRNVIGSGFRFGPETVQIRFISSGLLLPEPHPSSCSGSSQLLLLKIIIKTPTILFSIFL